MATPSLLSRVIESQWQDAEIVSIRDRVQSGTGDEGWTVHADGSLRYRGRVVVPQLTDLREEILREFHCSRFGVHPGGTKMYQDLRRQYYWSEIKRQVGDFVRRCLTCQQVKAEHQKQAGLLQPLEVVEWKWEHVTMDFVTHFPRTPQRHDVVWVIIDRLTKSAHFLAVRMTLVEFTYNNSYQASIQMAPYEVLYLRPCRSPLCWTKVGESSITGPDLIRDTSEKVSLIRQRLLTAQS